MHPDQLACFHFESMENYYLIPTHGGSNENKGEVKTVLGDLISTLHTDRRATEARHEAPCCVEGAQRPAFICNAGAGVRQVKRKLKSFTIKASICLNWSLYPVTGIAGGVGCPGNVLLFQGTVLVMAEGDFLIQCMSTPAFSYDPKKNNIMQEGDKVCSE